MLGRALVNEARIIPPAERFPKAVVTKTCVSGCAGPMQQAVCGRINACPVQRLLASAGALAGQSSSTALYIRNASGTSPLCSSVQRWCVSHSTA